MNDAARELLETTRTLRATDVMSPAEVWAELKMAMKEIDRLQRAIRGAQVAFCYDSPDAAMAILAKTGVQNV